jgi:hypothetical protein
VGGVQVAPDAVERFWYIAAMTKIEDVEKAVSSLSSDELAEFRAWFEAFDADQFDRKIERGARVGKLDGLADAAIAELKEGRAREL